jgi:hypothetical protein
LVGNTFEKFIKTSNLKSDALVMFYDPNDANYKVINPMIELLAYKLKSVKYLVFAKIDITNNEVDDHLESLSLRLYQRNSENTEDYHV